MSLSSNRAKAAVEYIIKNGNVDPGRISAKGYGETKLVNKCADGVKCSEADHQKNRRTELKIVGFEDFDPLENRSLADILIEEKLLREVFNSEQIQVGADEIPDFDKLQTKTKSTKVAGAKKTGETKAKVIKSTVEETAKSGATTSVKATSKKPAIETKTETKIETRGSSAAHFLNFKENEVLIVRNDGIQLMAKTIDNQLNTELTSLLAGKKINVQQDNVITTYQFEKQEDIPMGILNVFLNRVAIVEQANFWRLFPLKEKAEFPEALLEALK